MSDLNASGKVISARFRPDPLDANAIPGNGEFGFRQDPDGWKLVFTDPGRRDPHAVILICV